MVNGKNAARQPLFAAFQFVKCMRETSGIFRSSIFLLAIYKTKCYCKYTVYCFVNKASKNQ